MRIVYQSRSLSDAYAVQAALTSAGIASAVSGEHSVGTVAGGLAVHVASEEDIELARQVIREMLADTTEAEP